MNTDSATSADEKAKDVYTRAALLGDRAGQRETQKHFSDRAAPCHEGLCRWGKGLKNLFWILQGVSMEEMWYLMLGLFGPRTTAESYCSNLRTKSCHSQIWKFMCALVVIHFESEKKKKKEFEIKFGGMLQVSTCPVSVRPVDVLCSALFSFRSKKAEQLWCNCWRLCSLQFLDGCRRTKQAVQGQGSLCVSVVTGI